MFKVLLLLGSVLLSADCLNVLGLFPHPGRSHQDVFNPLLVELAERGHNLTIISHFDPPKQLANWKQISMGVFTDLHREAYDLNSFEVKFSGMDRYRHFTESFILSDLAKKMCEVLTNLPQVHDIVNNGEKFDVILVELFNSECAYGITHFIDAPVIGLQSHLPMPWTLEYYGQPEFSAYMPCIFLSSGPHMGFRERVENELFSHLYRVVFKYLAFMPEREIVQRNLNRTVPPLNEIAQRTSALLSNTHFTLHGPKPLLPGIVEAGGMHIRHTLAPLDLVIILCETSIPIFMN